MALSIPPPGRPGIGLGAGQVVKIALLEVASPVPGWQYAWPPLPYHTLGEVM